MNLFLPFFVLIYPLGSFGEEICNGTSGNSALVVIDMQPVFVKRHQFEKIPGNLPKIETMMREEMAAINLAKKSNIPIVVLEYGAIRGAAPSDLPTESSLKSALANYDQVRYIKKTTDGMLDAGNENRG